MKNLFRENNNNSYYYYYNLYFNLKTKKYNFIIIIITIIIIIIIRCEYLLNYLLHSSKIPQDVIIVATKKDPL